MDCSVQLASFGDLQPISRAGGQGRVYRPQAAPAILGYGAPVVVKLYRRSPPAAAERVLAAMISWSRALAPAQNAALHRITAWPVALVRAGGRPVGIVMRDRSDHFAVPFVMPSGRCERVLLSLEHLLVGDSYLQARGFAAGLDTFARTMVAERTSAALAFLHRHGIVASDIAPSNVLVSLRPREIEVCLIDCDSMVFRGKQALASVETGDWEMPRRYGEPARTRAADAYKLGLVVLRLYARCHDARAPAAHADHVPVAVRPLLLRALSSDAANRPTAGEWQRALARLLADPALVARHPGPARGASLVHTAGRHRAPGPPRHRRGPSGSHVGLTAGHLAATPRGGRFGSSAARRQGSTALSHLASPVAAPAAWPQGRQPPRQAVRHPATTQARPTLNGLRRTVALLWMLAATVVLFVVLSHLFASEINAAGDAGAGSQDGSPGVTYYVQPGPGVGAAPYRYLPAGSVP